jgi:hypothetical protein
MPKTEEIGGTFVFSGSKLLTPSKNSDQNKKIRPVAVDFLSEAHPLIPLSCRSNLARRYL